MEHKFHFNLLNINVLDFRNIKMSQQTFLFQKTKFALFKLKIKKVALFSCNFAVNTIHNNCFFLINYKNCHFF